jgi:hypothetical protein
MKVGAVIGLDDPSDLVAVLSTLRTVGINRNIVVGYTGTDPNAGGHFQLATGKTDSSFFSFRASSRGFGFLLQALPTLAANDIDVAVSIGIAEVKTIFEQAPSKGVARLLEFLFGTVMGSKSFVRTVLNAFCLDPLLGFVGPAEMFKSASFFGKRPSAEFTRLIQQIAPEVDPAGDCGFFLTSSFWFRPQAFNKIIGTHGRLHDSLHVSVPIQGQNQWDKDCFLAHGTINGLISQAQEMRTGLIYCTSDSKEVVIRLTEDTRIPNGSMYPREVSLLSDEDLQHLRALLRRTLCFDDDFYFGQYPDAKFLGGDAAWHYLRYGAYENCNPRADFDSDWYWEEHADEVKDLGNPFAHYVCEGKGTGYAVFPAKENIIAIMEKIAETGLFDPEHYLRGGQSGSVREGGSLEHFCTVGWKDLRAPCSGKRFDPIWYESEYLSHWRTRINPLLHFAVGHSERNTLARPKAAAARGAGQRLLKNAFRRACLFAAYDPDGIVDETVVHYVRELSHHADVFFLTNCDMPSSELSKISAYTKGAWQLSHSEADFGSYKRLAIHFVGRDELSQYDEVLLVNDSAYLLRPLDEVFGKMDGQACNWWGLQATKGVFATRNVEANRFPGKIAFAEVVRDLLPGFERQALYDFFMGSYFLAFRQPAYEELYRVLGSVRRERFKKNVIYKYEVNLSRRLILAGHPPGSFMDHLYPLHPVYTENHFDMIAEGFPLLKRVLFTENHYRVPDLWRWSEILNDLLPDLNLSPIKRNLERVCDPDRLRANLNISPNERFFVPANLSEIRYATAAASAVGEKCLSP